MIESAGLFRTFDVGLTAMSDSYQRGRAHARAFVSKWKQFESDSMGAVIDDLGERGRGRRTFRVTSTSRVRFAVGVAAMLLKGPNIRMTRTDYAQLSGLSIGAFDQLLAKDSSIEMAVVGEEGKEAIGPRKPGPQGKLVACVLKDVEFRGSMKDDAEFRRGFWDEFQRCFVEGETILTKKVQQFAEGYLEAFKSDRMLHAYEEYIKLIEETRSNILAFRGQKTDRRLHPEFDTATRRRITQNAEKASDFLTELSVETKEAIQHLRHGNFGSRMAQSTIRVNMDELGTMWLDLLRVTAMLYFVSPWATDEFVKYTEWDV